MKLRLASSPPYATVLVTQRCRSRSPLRRWRQLGELERSVAAVGEKPIVGLITKTDTNPFFVKMKEGAQAGRRRSPA